MVKTDSPVIEANPTLEDMVDNMRAIAATRQKIVRILEVIDAIAFQTDILALNGAVGAARADEENTLPVEELAVEVQRLMDEVGGPARESIPSFITR